MPASACTIRQQAAGASCPLECVKLLMRLVGLKVLCPLECVKLLRRLFGLKG